MVDPAVIFGRMGNRMFQGAYLYAQMRRGLINDFFVQDEEYFKEFSEEIKRLYGAGIGFIDKVSIHVRRAANPINPAEPKYSENPFYVNLCDTDYYQKAMAYFPNDKFLLSSDDLGWCKQQLMFKDCEFVDKEEVDNFNAMASCKSNIIANSSFSWWAAYLNPNPFKVVVAPKQWFADGVERTKLLKEWIKL